jgi:hypothetical protein
MVAEQYCTLATHKLEVARFHLREFGRLLEGEAKGRLADDPEVEYAPFHGHADGAIFEAFAAFDTYSCAVAHKFGVPRADRAALKTIAARVEVPPEISRRINDAIATDEWLRLEGLRNLAGHRGVVSETMRWGQHLKGGFQVHLPDGDEALPVMSYLIQWGEHQLEGLYVGVCDRERSILRLRRQSRFSSDAHDD